MHQVWARTSRSGRRSSMPSTTTNCTTREPICRPIRRGSPGNDDGEVRRAWPVGSQVLNSLGDASSVVLAAAIANRATGPCFDFVNRVVQDSIVFSTDHLRTLRPCLRGVVNNAPGTCAQRCVPIDALISGRARRQSNYDQHDCDPRPKAMFRHPDTTAPRRHLVQLDAGGTGG